MKSLTNTIHFREESYADEQFCDSGDDTISVFHEHIQRCVVNCCEF